MAKQRRGTPKSGKPGGTARRKPVPTPKPRPVARPPRRDDEQQPPPPAAPPRPRRLIMEFDDNPPPAGDGKIDKRVVMEDADRDGTFEKATVDTDTDLQGRDSDMVKMRKTLTMPLGDGRDGRYDKYMVAIDTDGDGKPDAVVETGDGFAGFDAQGNPVYRNVQKVSVKIKSTGM